MIKKCLNCYCHQLLKWEKVQYGVIEKLNLNQGITQPRSPNFTSWDTLGGELRMELPVGFLQEKQRYHSDLCGLTAL